MEQTLQNLPKHLMQKIATRATHWTKPTTDGRLPSIGNPTWKMLKYLSISQSWRHSCLPLYCQELSISMNRSLTFIEEQHYWSATIRGIQECHGTHLTRHAHVIVPVSAIIDGTLTKLLSRAPYKDARFPLCEVIWLKPSLGQQPLLNKDTGKWAQNIRGFVDTMYRIFPNTRTMSISSAITFTDTDRELSAYVSSLFTQLLQQQKTHSITALKYFAPDLCHYFDRSFASNYMGLTSIMYTECASSPMFVQLIRTNHETLQELCLEATDNVELFVQCVVVGNNREKMYGLDECCCLEYPRLAKLDIECTEDNVSSGMFIARCAPTGILFPRLEEVRLHLRVPDIHILLQHKVLGKNTMPNVTHLDISIIMHNVDQQQIDSSMFNQQQQYLELKYLRLTQLPLTILEVIEILRTLPRLAQLIIDPECPTTTINTTTHNDDDSYNRDLLQDTTNSVHQLVNKYKGTVVAPRLRHVVFGLGVCADMDGMSHFAVQLAVLCPQLTCVRWATYSSRFADNCVDLVGSPMYQEYAERLRLVDWEKRR
ncbi:hypothetical protein IWW50_003531 [Coemansia erecta]|nr:hypothetical protein IWW50_003531 [Coemansia erecta]